MADIKTITLSNQTYNIKDEQARDDISTINTALNSKLNTSDYVVDNELSNSSTNPVQNSIIYEALSTINTELSSKVETSDVINSITQNSTKPIQSGAVYTGITNVNNDIGNKANLTTTVKSNLVAAINELNTTLVSKANTSLLEAYNGKGFGIMDTVANFDSYTTPGVYWVDSLVNKSNKPKDDTGEGILEVIKPSASGNTIIQKYTESTTYLATGFIWHRTSTNNGSTWGRWVIDALPDIESSLDTKLNKSDVIDDPVGLTSRTNPVSGYVVQAGLSSKVNKSDIDSTLSSSSENPVQNKVIYEALSDIYENKLDISQGFEDGANGNWTWRKWNNGVLECWYKNSAININVNNPWHNLYYATILDSFAFPVAFKHNTPMKLVFLDSGDASVWAANYTSTTPLTYTGTIIAISASSGMKSIGLNLYAKGTWK